MTLSQHKQALKCTVRQLGHGAYKGTINTYMSLKEVFLKSVEILAFFGVTFVIASVIAYILFGWTDLAMIVGLVMWIVLWVIGLILLMTYDIQLKQMQGIASIPIPVSRFEVIHAMIVPATRLLLKAMAYGILFLLVIGGLIGLGKLIAYLLLPYIGNWAAGTIGVLVAIFVATFGSVYYFNYRKVQKEGEC